MNRVTTRPSKAHVRVFFGDEVIADTRAAVELHESARAVVYYIQREDVRMDRLERSSHRTHCPFKGDASYFSVAGGPENAVWSYEAPYDEMLAIRERLAFYPDKFRIESH